MCVALTCFDQPEIHKYFAPLCEEKMVICFRIDSEFLRGLLRLPTLHLGWSKMAPSLHVFVLQTLYTKANTKKKLSQMKKDANNGV